MSISIQALDILFITFFCLAVYLAILLDKRS